MGWGDNAYGQLGFVGTTSRVNTPQLLPIVAKPLKYVCGGWFHSVGLLGFVYGFFIVLMPLAESGEVLAWGYNTNGQLGNGTAGKNSTQPVHVLLPAPAVAISCDKAHHCGALLGASFSIGQFTPIFFYRNRRSVHLGSQSMWAARHWRQELPTHTLTKYRLSIPNKLFTCVVLITTVQQYLVVSPFCCSSSWQILEMFTCGERMTTVNSVFVLLVLAIYQVHTNLLNFQVYWIPSCLGLNLGLQKPVHSEIVFVANPPESGEILTWGISSQFTDESSKICEPPHILELPKNYRAIMAFCGRYHAVTVVALKLPTWSFLKPLLVGWQRDTNCCFHHSKGIPLHIVQLIVEFTWECELPTPLAVLCNKSLTTC